MEYKIEVTEEAYEDIERIYNYIYKILLNPTAAKRTVASIFNGIDKLMTFPERGGKLFIHLPISYRFVLSGNYQIIYRIDNDTVWITRVMHIKQDIMAELQLCMEVEEGKRL